MKILYFGTVCNIDNYNKILENSKQKPSVATTVFENAMLAGFWENHAQIEIHSFPMIPTFPASRLLHFGRNREHLACGYECRWLHTVNLPVLKQWSRRLDARKVLRRWRKENKEDGLIFTYSIPPFLAKDILRYGKKNGMKTVAIIPDLLRDMYVNENQNTLLAKLKQMYLKPALKRQGQYDGYIYLTEAMRDVVAPDKPYMVMEGIADPTTHAQILPGQKKSRAIMYAGMLHKKYGILNLVDAFRQLSMPDVELWLFGEGTAVEEIQARAAEDPRIRYFGSRPRQEILEYERQAMLLVNPRDPQEAFTKYSFPSKTVEYMLSGTPVLTTRLPGIPEEYFQYVFFAEDNRVETLAAAIREALSHGGDALEEKGKQAQDFIRKEKNAKKQASRMLAFMQEVQK